MEIADNRLNNEKTLSNSMMEMEMLDSVLDPQR